MNKPDHGPFFFLTSDLKGHLKQDHTNYILSRVSSIDLTINEVWEEGEEVRMEIWDLLCFFFFKSMMYFMVMVSYFTDY